MPYSIVKGKGDRPWKIKKGNKIVGTSTSKAKAQRSLGYREAAEATPKNIKKFKRKVNNKLNAYGETDYGKKIVTINKSKKKNKKKGDILDTIVHEKRHIQHPNEHEKTVRKKTKQIIKTMNKKLKQKHYGLFSK